MLNKIFLFYLLILFVKGLKERSNEFYDCIDPEKIVTSSSRCTNIKIPESEGYKCCSMKISFNGNISYSCFALENEFTTNKQKLDEYIVNKNLGALFGVMEGQIEIECGQEIQSIQNYEKMSDEYLNCYKNHLSGVNDENDCHKYNIPEKEKSNCCFVETQTKDNTGNIIEEKRCYIIQEAYFTQEKNLENYLLDKTNRKSLDQIKNVNITINCKNHDIFDFSGKFDEINYIDNNIKSTYVTEINPNTDNEKNKKKKSGTNKGLIAAIVIVSIIVLIGAAFLIFYFFKKRKETIDKTENIDILEKVSDRKNDIIDDKVNKNRNININNIKSNITNDINSKNVLS